GADSAYVSLLGNDMFTFIAQAKAAGLFDKIKLWADLGTDIATVQTVGMGMPENWWTFTPWYAGSENASALSKSIADTYMAQNDGKTPNGTIAAGIVSIQALVAAINKAGSTESDKVIAALEGLKF